MNDIHTNEAKVWSKTEHSWSNFQNFHLVNWGHYVNNLSSKATQKSNVGHDSIWKLHWEFAEVDMEACVKRREPHAFSNGSFFVLFLVAFLSADCHFLRPSLARDTHLCNEQLQSEVYNWAFIKQFPKLSFGDLRALCQQFFKQSNSENQIWAWYYVNTTLRARWGWYGGLWFVCVKRPTLF